jgi:hypothetical protein
LRTFIVVANTSPGIRLARKCKVAEKYEGRKTESGQSKQEIEQVVKEAKKLMKRALGLEQERLEGES